MRILPFLCATTALAMPVAAYAQQITTEIQGTVTDSSGAPVAGATVEIEDTRTGATRTITTGNTGSFSATGLTTGGPYTVTATAEGLQGQTVNDIATSLEGATRLTFSLDAATAAEEAAIVVTGSRVRLTQLEVGPGTSFSQEVLAAAPTFNRDVRDVIRIDPRVSLDRDDGGSGQDRISCLGGNDRGNLFTVDGISQGDVYGLNDTGFSSRSSTPLPYDAIRETQVQFAPFDVEYGQFTGCAINVVTRGGTNRITGGAYFEYSNNDLRGEEVSGRPVAPVNPEKRWGVNLGGPIIKDRLFIFGAYEHQEAGQSQDEGPAGAGFANEQAGVPVAAFNQISEILSRVYGIETGPLLKSRDYNNDRYFVRADLQITDDHRLEGTYQRLEEATVRADDIFTGTSPQITGANTFYNSGTISNYYSGRLYSTWSDRLSTELRYSRSEVTDRQDPLGGGEAQSDNPIPRIIVGIANSAGVATGAVLAGPGTSRSANDLQTKVEQYRALLNYDAGNHNLKFGFELNRADIFNLFVQNATGTLVFRNAADLEQGLLSPGRANAPLCSSATTTTTAVNVVNGCTYGAFGNFTSDGNINTAAAQFKRSVYSAYVQDDWQATDKLNVVLGVRTDWFSGDAPTLNTVFRDRYGFGNDVGFDALDPVVLPRIAFNYDFDDAGAFSRSQLKMGVGIFSGGDPLVWFGNAFQNNGIGFAEGTTAAAGCPTGQIDVVVNNQFTGLPTCFAQAAQTSAARGLGDTQSINPDIKMPTVTRFNIGFSTRFDLQPSGFLSGWNFSADYIYSRFNNPFGLVDLSQVPASTGGSTAVLATTRPIGLGGYAIDGRPIYRSIDPNATGCDAELVSINPTPVFRNVSAACFVTSRDDELQLVNTQGFRSHNLSFILSKNFDRGVITQGGNVFFSLGYAYTNSQDRRSMYNSTAGSNYDLVAAFDRQNPAPSRGFYESRHNISFNTSLTEQFVDDLDTRLSATFVARSGRPYSLTFAGATQFNDSASGNDNALAYIPTGLTDPRLSPSSDPAAVANLVNFLNTIDCDDEYRGRTIARNTCTNDWYLDLDLMLSQEIPGPGRLLGRNDKLRAYVMFDNFLNFLDQDWNVQRRRNFAGVQEITGVGTNGVDAQGRYIITALPGGFATGTNFTNDNTINISSSVWRVKVGVSYEF